MKKRATKHPDHDLIEKLGGSGKVAERLGGDFTVARVSNWTRRGVPELLRYKRPDVFGSVDQKQAA